MDDATTANLAEIYILMKDPEPVPEIWSPWFAAPPAPLWQVAPDHPPAQHLPRSRPRRTQCRGRKPNFLERGKD